MVLVWCCTRDRKVCGNFPTGVQRYLTVASSDGKTEKSPLQSNCLWDEHDENETNEIPRRRVVRSDDDELSLARTNSGSLCDSKFRAVKTDARSFSFPPSIRQQPLFVQCELSAAKTLQGTPYSVDWLPLAGSVISQPIAEVILFGDETTTGQLLVYNVIIYYIGKVPC